MPPEQAAPFVLPDNRGVWGRLIEGRREKGGLPLPTLFLSPRNSTDSIALWNAARNSGWEATRLSGYRVPPEVSASECAVYGEPLFVAAVAEALSITPAEPPLDWLPCVPRSLRRRNVWSGTWEDVASVEAVTFIKPADDKCFPAAVYAHGAELTGAYDLPSDLPVLFSDPVVWDVEFRCFVQEGVVVALSPYSRLGALAQAASGEWLATDEERVGASRFAADVLDAYGGPAAFVLDVGVIHGEGWAVVEANAVCSSGIYGCEPSAVLETVWRACRPSESAG